MSHRRAAAVCWSLAAASSFFAPFAHSLSAQQSRPATLQLGTLVRVTTPEGSQIEGRVVRFDSDVVGLARGDGSQSTVARVDVRSLEMARSRTGRYAKRGALVGAIGGGGAGGVFLDEFCSGSTTCRPATYIYVVGLGVVAGAVAGTVIGALVGSTGRDWVEVRPGIWEAAGRRLDPLWVGALDRSLPALHVSLRVPLPD
ncbi:MAG: hypothetical protein HKN72_17055 [Gemmatimonadetes bacterium]|nr:hypothetical protein [Gemmatimonadota bacterium]NNL31065.1 hypothetical protein [Gemmatimonadota bacterium]